jgi:hypothetical protein
MRYTYTDAMLVLRPGSAFTIKDDLWETLQWFDSETTAPTEAEVAAQRDQLQAAWDHTHYQRQRAMAYPSIGDQLDALYRAGAFPQDMADQIAAVKARYPKP